MGRIDLHITGLTRVLLAVLMLLASIPYRAPACPLRERAELRRGGSCCAKKPAPPAHKGCCGEESRKCCCTVAPMVIPLLDASGAAGVPVAVPPTLRFIEPLRTSPSAPPIPPPRS